MQPGRGREPVMRPGDAAGHDDVRRQVTRTDDALRDPRLVMAQESLGRDLVRSVVSAAQERARRGEIGPHDVVDDTVARLPAHAAGLSPVLNATGVLLHTNLGRAPLSAAALDAVVAAAGCTDVEFDLEHGRRARRGRSLLDALLTAVPAAEDALVVNNNAAALVLAATALAQDREIVVSRGELVEIGDGFRLPTLLESTGARLREVGTTNRTSVDDYLAAVGPSTAFVLKVHPSNFTITGFTSAVGVRELAAALPVPVVSDIGSGLLHPDRSLPDEPDATTHLLEGAALVTASTDKLLGGPQGGLLLGDRSLVETARRHPLARALRIDKLTIAGLEATLRGPVTPTATALHATVSGLRQRAEGLAGQLTARGIAAEVVSSTATVGGGGAPGVELQSFAVALPAPLAEPLRRGDPAVVGRVDRGRCLLDLRAVPPESDDALAAAVLRAAEASTR
jgi:L-seryl-tRNA(Ser) seleniumtransferase